MFPTTSTPPGEVYYTGSLFTTPFGFGYPYQNLWRYIPAEQFFILDAFSPVSYLSFWQEFLMRKHSLEDMFT